MDPALFELVSLAAGFVSLVGVLLGLYGLLRKCKRGWGWQGAVAAFGVLLVFFGLVALWMELPRTVWLAVLGLGFSCLTLQGLQIPWVNRCVGELLLLLQRPWISSGVLLGICPLVAIWSGLQLTPASDDLAGADSILHHEQMTEVATVHAATDRGHIVPVYTLSESDLQSASPSLDDARITRDYLVRLIRTAPSDLTHNCHGWVFAAGLHWVKSRDVQTILDDNGYTPVIVPQVGDVVIYRNSSGEIVHSGLVRAADPSLVLVESKWGALGRYVHRPAEQCYGEHFSYYHSSRRGHVLQGINSTLPSNPPTLTARRAG